MPQAERAHVDFPLEELPPVQLAGMIRRSVDTIVDLRSGFETAEWYITRAREALEVDDPDRALEILNAVPRTITTTTIQ